MPDDLTKTGKEDDVRINVKQIHERTYWAERLGCSQERLKKAVAAVGPMVADVTQWLVDNPTQRKSRGKGKKRRE